MMPLMVVFLLSFVFDSPVVVVVVSGSSTCDGAMPMISMISRVLFCGELDENFPPIKKRETTPDVSSMVARGDEEDAEKDSATTTTKERRPIPPLHVAARTGDLDALSALLASNHHHHHHRNDAAKNNTKKNTALKFIDERDVHGRTALHLAAWANEKAIAERLLDSGADVSVGAADGVQAIHFACMKGHLGKTMLLFCIPIVYTYTHRYRENARLSGTRQSREYQSENE
jgi:hypothetical protein